MFVVQYTARAIKSLEKIPQKWRERIIKAANNLAKDPYAGKKLRGELTGCYAIRAWPYRIIYTIKKREVTVIVLNVGHRQNAYGSLDL